MIKKTNTIYGEKLKRLRVNAFITQKQIAVKFNMTQQGYGGLENGLTKFNDKKVEKICKIFNVSSEEFLTLPTKQRKMNVKKPDSYAVKVLKKHYEVLLLEKEIEIKKLQIQVKHLTKDKKINKIPPKLHVIA
jgi:transcriptional regulator with XRE-family HTH domain